MPPKAKKKKKESPEQRRQREAMEALQAAEEEAARRATAAAALRGRVSRETELTAINSRRLNVEWLQRMRNAKLEELHAEAGALSRAHDAQIDRQDRLIETLLEEVAVQNTQHDTAVAAHAEVLNSLIALHQDRTKSAHAQFEGDLHVMQEEFESEKAEISALHNRHKKELADVTSALTTVYTETRAEAAASYRLMEEELRNRASESLNVMKLSLEGRVRELEGAVEAQHRNYVEATGTQEAAYKELAAADAEAAEAIAQRTARLRQLQETLAQWRGRVVTNSNEWQRRNSALAKEKEIVLGHHTALKAALASFRRAQEARLKQMCVSYAAVEAKLKEHLATAERIIRLAQLSRKHELPRESAAVAVAAAEAAGDGAEGVAAAGDNVQAAATAAGTQEAADSVEGGGGAAGGNEGTSSDTKRISHAGERDELGLACGSSEQRLLEAFMQRMNGVALDAAALAQERLRLSAENATLRAVVAAVQTGTSVGPGSVEDPLSTLLVVNGRLQKELGSAALARRAAGASTCGGSRR